MGFSRGNIIHFRAYVCNNSRRVYTKLSCSVKYPAPTRKPIKERTTEVIYELNRYHDFSPDGAVGG